MIELSIVIPNKKLCHEKKRLYRCSQSSTATCTCYIQVLKYIIIYLSSITLHMFKTLESFIKSIIIYTVWLNEAQCNMKVIKLYNYSLIQFCPDCLNRKNEHELL